jgi:hypothetical protein
MTMFGGYGEAPSDGRGAPLSSTFSSYARTFAALALSA